MADAMTRLCLATALLAGASVCVTAPLPAQEAGELRLRDFKPRSMPRLPVHEVRVPRPHSQGVTKK